ncbi:MAG: hypothetical protein GC160_22035 [Acidobacteria bacterium]|nr:hypothetical protein [Acidobacteriota bacterium]
MAGVAAVLVAAARLVRRDFARLGGLPANNFVIFGLILANQGGNNWFFSILIGLVLLLALSVDPLSSFPAARRASWPLTPAARRVVRLGALATTPTVWILVGLFVWRGAEAVVREAVAAAAVGGLLVALGSWALRRAPQRNPLALLPAPPGLLGPLWLKDLRQMLRTLDAGCAMAVSLVGCAGRFWVGLDWDGRMTMAVLVVIALSSYAQRLFGPDAVAGLDRYRIAPIRGWQALGSKAAAFVTVGVALTLPLDPLSGLASSLAAVAVGFHPSTSRFAPLPPWSLAGAVLLPHSLTQGVLLIGAAVVVARQTPLALAPIAAGAVIAAFWYGRRFERRLRR